MDYFESACRLLPASIADRLRIFKDAEEIRLRIGKKPSCLISGRELAFSDSVISTEDILYVIEKASESSVHSVMSSLRNGFVDYHGLRIGVCGQAAISDGKLIGFSNYSSLAIRIPHPCRNICRDIAEALLARGAENTLIIGPPGAGKTTVLRELIRRFSDSGFRVGVADERNELSASVRGTAGFDLGKQTDIISNLDKASAAMMLLRGMNPSIIAMDEVTKQEDAEAIHEIIGCGVGIIATAHGGSAKELRKRDVYRKMLTSGAFNNLLTVSCSGGERVYSLESI